MKKLKLLLVACALLVSAGVQAQKDVTSEYITNAKLSNGTTGWTVSNFNTPVNGNGNNEGNGVDGIKYGWQNNATNSVNVTGAASEAYAGWGSVEKTSYYMKQSVTLPEGSYRLVCYAFYREGESYNTDVNTSRARLFAGTKAETNIATLGSITAGSYANSQQAGAICFDTKMYRKAIEFTVGEGGETFDIGVDGTFDIARSWCILGQFELFDMNNLASVSSPTDMTYAITNPGFEYRNLEGWTNGDGSTYALTNTEAFNSRAGIYWVEKWTSSNNGGKLGTQDDFKQTLSNMPAGLYELSVYAHNVEQGNGDAAGTGMYVMANSDKTEIGAAGQYKVRTTLATDGDLTVGIKLDNCSGNWIAFDRFELKFFGDPLKAYQDLLDEAVTGAQALIDGTAGSAISATAKAAWQAVVDDNDNNDNAFTEESQFTAAIENITNANTNYQAMAAPYALWKKVKAGADAMVLVPNDNSSATTELTSAVSTQNTAAEAALTAADLNTAINTLKVAIRTFISATEPTGGNKFEITCLVENPSFDDNTITGWTRNITKTGGNAQTTFTCNEFWNNTFDFYQDLQNLPNGSYQLTVQAFSRPGGNDTAYPAYVGGVNSVTAELYVNEDASTVGNIYAHKGNTTGPKAGGGFPDYECTVVGGTNYWVPNGMEGASLYFADEDVYKTTVAALVEDGNLRIGFRDETFTANQWTIFDNFRLYYYGSDKTVYYEQYLPQLIAEVEADKSNALYANVTGKELSDLNTALGVDASGFTTEEEYSNAINAIKDAQTAYREAYPAYDALVAAKAETKLEKVDANIGTGVFQYNATTNYNLYTAYETDYNTMKATSAVYSENPIATAENINTTLTAYNTSKAAYLNQELNAPDASKRYWVTIIDGEKEWNGNAITFIAGGREEDGLYNIKYEAPENANLNQALKFTAVDGEANTYKVSGIRVENGSEQYFTTKLLAYGNGSNEQLRTTDDATKAMKIKIQATTTDGQFKLLNVEADNAVIARNATNPDNGVYTDGDANFTIAEADQASVDVNILAANQYGTRIFPFTPTLPDGVKAYSCSEATGKTLTLVEVSTLAANTPYILFAENGYSGDALTGWGIAGDTKYTVGLLTGVYANTEAPVGSYVLQRNDDIVAFYEVNGGEDNQPTVGANRCYLNWPDGSNARAFFFPENNATAIKAINALTSGKAEIFNASGVQIPALQKGMNIIRTADGKSLKVMVK